MRALLVVALLVAVLALAALWFTFSADAGLRGTRLEPPGPPSVTATAESAATSADERAVDPSRAPITIAESSAQPTDDEPVTEAFGRVLDATGAPIAGAHVYLAASRGSWLRVALDVEADAHNSGWADVRECVTDAEGRYAFEGLEPGSMRVVARAAGFRRTSVEDWRLPPERPHRFPDLVMERGAVLSGRVVDESGEGVPHAQVLAAVDARLEGIEVTHRGRGIPLAETDEDGRFRIDEVAPGEGAYLVDSREHVPLAVSVEVGERGRTGLLFVLRSGDEVTGRVVGAIEGELRVTARRLADEVGEVPGFADADPARPREGECEPDGSFRVAGLLPGTGYRLSLSRRDASGRWKRVESAEAPEVTAGERDVLLHVGGDAVLVFRAVDAATGSPVERFAIYVGRERPRLVVDSGGEPWLEHPDGRARCEGLELPRGGGPVDVLVRADGFLDRTVRDVQLSEHEERDLGRIELARAGAIDLAVLDAGTGGPVADALVVWAPGDGRALARRAERILEREPWSSRRVRFARSGADGHASLSVEPGVPTAVVARAEGYMPSEPEVFGATGASGRMELRLRHGGAVVVRVTDPSGAPLADEVVLHRESSFEHATDEDGELALEHLAPGVHGFRLGTAIGHRTGVEPPPWREVTVTEGGSVAVDLVGEPRSILFGHVTEAGTPLPGAEMRLVSDADLRAGSRGLLGSGAARKHVRADSEGAYRFPGLPAGDYTLIVDHPTRAMPDEVALTLLPGERVLDLDLSVSVVEGRVLDPDGLPVAGARVQIGLTGGSPSGHGLQRLAVVEDERGVPSLAFERPRERASVTGEDGRFTLRGVRPGVDLTLTVHGDGLEPTTSAPFRLGPDEVRADADVVVARAGRLEVQLGGLSDADESWYRISASKVVAAGEHPRVRQTYVTPLRPLGELRGLSAGTWEVSVFRRDHNRVETAVSSQRVEVRAGDVTTVHVDIR